MTQTVERMLPLYEAKMIHQYDHRWATYEPDGTVRDVTLAEKQDPRFVVMPRYWVREVTVTSRMGHHPEALCGYRWIARSTDERTLIACELPTGAAGNSLPVFVQRRHQSLLVALMSSFVCDYVARQKLGGANMTYSTVYQIAAPNPESFGGECPWDRTATQSQWIVERTKFVAGWVALQLRGRVRAELDAAFFHLYGLTREEVDYIMDTFPIVQRKDLAEFGEYRTKRLILEIYDAMQHAIDTGVGYTSAADLGVSG